MKRDLHDVSSREYDVLIIGGGIYGSFMAWEAVTRGLSVALVEKNDFGSATSSNSQKIIHGGFRYLQHADLKRVRESVRERTHLMQIAPHLIHPLPVLLPTYGRGLKSQAVLKIALSIYDALSWDRNRNSDPGKNIPRGILLSKEEVLKIAPGIEKNGLTGGAVFYDAQVYNSERLILAILKSAHLEGAKLANYAQVTGFLKDKNGVTGVKILNSMDQTTYEIRSLNVINTGGPWVKKILSLATEKKEPLMKQVKCFNLVTKKIFDTYAVGLYGHDHYQDQDAILNKGSRLFFVTPWRGHSVVGTYLSHYEDEPDKMQVSENDIEELIRDFSRAYPPAQLKRRDISLIQKGFLPGSHKSQDSNAQIAKHYQIVDHARDGVDHLISVIGVKYTTARDVAEKTIDYVLKKMNRPSSPSNTARIPLYGGEISHFKNFTHEAIQKEKRLPPDQVSSLIRNYGSKYPEVLKYLPQDKNISPLLALLQSEILHGIHEEMAQTLRDIVFRRTDIGTLGYPGKETLEFCARVMKEALGRTEAEAQAEIRSTENSYPFIS